MKKEEKIENLSEASQYVLNYFIDKKIQRRSFSTLDPRYNAQMAGLEDAIYAGYIFIKQDPLNPHRSYVRPTKKLIDLYQ